MSVTVWPAKHDLLQVKGGQEKEEMSGERPDKPERKKSSGGINFSDILFSRFNVGARVDRSGGRGRDRPSKGRRAPAPLIPHRRLPPTLDNVSVAVLKQWESSFEALLQDSDGIELFENFLKSEFSEENIQFWKACERYKGLPKSALQKEAEMIFDEFISQQAPKLVNIDHQTTKEIIENMKSPDYDTFTRSQQSIYLLMARDSFVRFVRSELFQAALRR